MVPEDLIAAVLAHTDIVELITSYTPLQSAGKNYKGICIFHKEKTSSLSVSPEKKIFKCFGCGVGGDAIKFLMKAESKNFPEAVYSLALRAGLLEGEISDKIGTVYLSQSSCLTTQLKADLNSTGEILVLILNSLLKDCGCSKPNL